MDIREPRYFAAVFRERNLTVAAKRCFISQPSISAAITNLEAELGAALFIRHKKGMAPTEAAEQFNAVARRIIGLPTSRSVSSASMMRRMRGSFPKTCCAPTSISCRSGSSATSQRCRRRIR